MRRLGGAAAAAAAVMVLMTGCGTQATAPTASPTVTVAPSTPASSAAALPSPTVTVTETTGPSSSASSTPASSTPATSSAADGNAPAGQCDDSSIGVTITADAGGGAAGSVYSDVLFTNTGGSSCVLRGTPGMSVVGDGNGTQLGPAADRIQTGVRSLRLAVGESVSAPLKVVDIGTDGGPLDGCRVVHGDGYRVYPPHSRKAIFVKDAGAVACASGPVFMTVGPVVRVTG